MGDVNNLDKTPLTNFYKDSSALAPNEGSLVVFESDKVSNEITKTPTEIQVPTSTEQQKFPTMTLIIVAALSLIIGTIIGTVSSKIFSKKNANIS